MAKRYYWLKLKADWFSDKRIKKLRSIAGGDTHTIIYLKMMLLSLKDEGNPEDVPHARIYGRLLEMCTPVRFTGDDFRRAAAQQKKERLKELMMENKTVQAEGADL